MIAAWNDYRAAAYAVREAAGYNAYSAIAPERALACALTAHVVGGTADPIQAAAFGCSVIGPDGERIMVWPADSGRAGLDGGLVARLDQDKCDQIALVAL